MVAVCALASTSKREGALCEGGDVCHVPTRLPHDYHPHCTVDSVGEGAYGSNFIFPLPCSINVVASPVPSIKSAK